MTEENKNIRNEAVTELANHETVQVSGGDFDPGLEEPEFKLYYCVRGYNDATASNCLYPTKCEFLQVDDFRCTCKMMKGTFCK